MAGGYSGLPQSRRQSINEPDFSAFEDVEPDDTPSSPLLPTHHGEPHSTATTNNIPGAYDFEPQVPPPPPVNHRSRPSYSAAQRTASARSLQRPRASTASVSLIPESYHQRLRSLTDRIPFLSALTGSTSSPQAQRGNRDAEASTESEGEGHRLLFAHDDDDVTDSDEVANERRRQAASYPPPGTHLPLPARPPAFAAPATPHGRVVGGGQGNDGVFANLSAKPDNVRRGAGGEYVGGDDDGSKDDEVLPAYEVAAMDTTPPYWETTVHTPTGFLGPDDICVDGLPVGNVFSFAWNMLVSMSFQFVGFLLTYLLHTTHAAKNGSRAGLGITLIQLGFYLKQRVDHPELFLNEINGNGDATGLGGAPGPGTDSTQELQGWSWWGGTPPIDPLRDASDAGSESMVNTALAAAATGTLSALGSLPTQLHSALSNALDASDPDAIPQLMGNQGEMTSQQAQEMMRMSASANEWVAFFLVTVGSFLLIGGCLSYWRAVRFAKAVRQGMDDAAAETAIA